jgi:hypothetical protein
MEELTIAEPAAVFPLLLLNGLQNISLVHRANNHWFEVKRPFTRSQQGYVLVKFNCVYPTIVSDQWMICSLPLVLSREGGREAQLASHMILELLAYLFSVMIGNCAICSYKRALTGKNV